MRHGAARALLADAAPPALVQKQLRQSDPRLTLAVYAHVLGDQQRTAVQNLYQARKLVQLVETGFLIEMEKISCSEIS